MKYCPICDRSYDDRFVACELDGATLRVSGPKQDALVGAILKGRYRVLKKLGEGGMGAVYLADQFSINRKVALKILHANYARDEAFVRRFRQEARLAASFSHHNVITVYDFDQSNDGRLYIVMEYIDGRTLNAVIKDNPINLKRALGLGIQIAEGLAAAHQAGIIHRDIKPENIMVVGDGENVKLMDFGIARLTDSAATTRLTRPGMIMGTPAYMAPEQIEGTETSERTDIYAFGIILYELLTSLVPFNASTTHAVLLKHLRETPLPVRRIRNEIPISVERIVSRALEKKPQKRFSTMAEIVEALKQAQRHTVVEVTTRRRGWMIAASASLFLLVAGTLGVVAYNNLGSSSTTSATPPDEPQPSKPMPAFPTPEGKFTEKTQTESSSINTGSSSVGRERKTSKPIEEAVAPPKPSPKVSTVTKSNEPAKRSGPDQEQKIVQKPEPPSKGARESESETKVASVKQSPVSQPVIKKNNKASSAESEIASLGPTETPRPPPRLVLENVSIVVKKTELNVKEQIPLTLKGKYSDGSESDIKSDVQWKSSDSSVASVNSSGEIQALKEGTTRISATYRGISSDNLTFNVRASQESIKTNRRRLLR